MVSLEGPSLVAEKGGGRVRIASWEEDLPVLTLNVIAIVQWQFQEGKIFSAICVMF